jgi:hypothetical protein
MFDFLVVDTRHGSHPSRPMRPAPVCMEELPVRR